MTPCSENRRRSFVFTETLLQEAYFMPGGAPKANDVLPEKSVLEPKLDVRLGDRLWCDFGGL